MKIFNKAILSNIHKSPLLYVVIICIIAYASIYNIFDAYFLFPDSATYIHASNLNPFRGNLDYIRTPGYPFFIKVIRALFGKEDLYMNIVKAHYVLLFISVILFFFSVKKITDNKLLQGIFTLLYGLSPYILFWNHAIGTEPMSLFSITLLIYLTISYLHKPGYSLAVILGLYIFYLVMVRPAFLFLVALYIIFWLLRFVFNRNDCKYNITGLASTIVSILCILIYCSCINMQYGKFAITTVSMNNNIENLIKSRTYGDAQNKKIVEFINQSLLTRGEKDASMWIICKDLRQNFSDKELDAFYRDAMKANFLKYIAYLVKKTITIAPHTVGVLYVYSHFSGISFLSLPFTFAHMYILLIVSTIYIIYILSRYKRINWLFSFLVCVIGGTLFTAIVGAPFEWQRLFATALPSVMLLFSYFVEHIVKNMQTSEHQPFYVSILESK